MHRSTMQRAVWAWARIGKLAQASSLLEQGAIGLLRHVGAIPQLPALSGTSLAQPSSWDTGRCRTFASSSEDPPPPPSEEASTTSDQQQQPTDASSTVYDPDSPDFDPESFGPVHSPEEYNRMLDTWGKLMDKQDYESAWMLLQRSIEDVEGMRPVEEVLAEEDEDERDRRLRREMELEKQKEAAAQRVRVVDALGRAYATGKRKCSVARIWLKEGSGQIVVNAKPYDAFFGHLNRRVDVLMPFCTTGTLGEFDVMATVKGGGVMGQSQALRHGIAKALQLFDPRLRPELKAEGLLTRDSRIVERKKPGRAKARKSFQWVKR